MSPTPTVDYSSTTSTPHTGNDTMLAAAGAQLLASISTGKKGLSGSIIAGATIGGIVVAILIVALFFGLRHHYRRSRGQTASTAEAAPENEHEKEKCTEANESSSGHCLAQVVTYQSGAVQEAPSNVVVCQSGVPSPSSPRRSSDSSGTLPTQINHYNITTHAPRPQSYRMCPCPSCVLAPTATSALTEADISVGSPKGEYQIYDRNSCLPSTSPPLPPGAMPPLPSPTLESYQENFRTSPPPQSPSSPGGSSLRRWIMTPLSRSGTIRTPLPAYERPGSGLQRRVSDKKDESALAASVYTFM